ncbi:adenylyl-sulfate kinase [Salix suchowensis]|nr:adenylyl-sulfate kinase [Salix suchowensis]
MFLLEISRPNCETPYKGRSKGLSLYHSQKVTEEEEFPMSSLGNSNNIFWQECPVGKLERQKLINQKGCVVWITGLSGSE